MVVQYSLTTAFLKKVFLSILKVSAYFFLNSTTIEMKYSLEVTEDTTESNFLRQEKKEKVGKKEEKYMKLM